MLNQDQVKTIASRRGGGEGLEDIIESLGLPLVPTMLELRAKYRKEMDDAKALAKKIEEIDQQTANGGFVS